MYWKSPPVRIIEHHQHSFFEILILTCGTYELTVGRRQYTARAGDVVLLPAGLAHSEQNPPEDPPEFYHIRFYWPDAPHGLPLKLQDKDSHLRLLTSWMLERWAKESRISEAYRRGSLDGILAEVLQLAEEHEAEFVIRVRQYIIQNMDKPITLAQLAAHARLSLNYFGHHYRRTCGQTPMNDLRRIRLARAKQLLLSTNLPIKQVAVKVGFSNESSLSHALRKYEGLSPTEIRGMRKSALR